MFIELEDGRFRGNVDNLPIGFEYEEDDGKVFCIVEYKGVKHRALGGYDEFNTLGVRKQKELLYPKHMNGIVISFKPIKKENKNEKQ